MTRLLVGTIGSDKLEHVAQPCVDSDWSTVISRWMPDGLRPVQADAIPLILYGSQNFVIDAPTNSGKTFCAQLELLRSVRNGRRAVLIEPMRVLAYEQAKSLETVISRIGEALGCSPSVRISTGEFRHSEEFMSDPPPAEGEILVITPERLDLILRNPDNDAFIASIGSIVVDEAHLLFDPSRGPTLEAVLTALMLIAENNGQAPPRLLLLSATFSDRERIRTWLGAQLLATTARYPSLTTWVESSGDQADANKRIIQECTDLLRIDSNSVLVFVYRTRDAISLAKALESALGQPVEFAHSQMSSAAKTRSIELFSTGACRVLVASSALAMGVNLPCTHVIVRDTHYPGVGPLPVHQLRQMCGRAGRGNNAGQALVLVQAIDGRGATGVRTDLASGNSDSIPKRRRGTCNEDVSELADGLAALMARFHDRGVDRAFISNWHQRSLTGAERLDRIPAVLEWMSRWKLASTEHSCYQDGRWRLTIGGRTAATHGLPLRIAASTLQLWRDMLELDPTDRLLSDWSPLDHLILIELLADRSPTLRRDSADLMDAIESWMERNAANSPSVLWREWLHHSDEKGEEVLGSLGITDKTGKPLAGTEANRQIRQALLRSIVLSERMRGAPTEQLARQWHLTTFEGIEEKTRDHRIWLSHGIAQLADWPSLSWHCNHQLRVDQLRKERIKNVLRGIRFRALSTCGSLSTCSPLGALLPGLRKQGGQVNAGVGTLRALEAAGVTSPAQLVHMTETELAALGVRRDLAASIVRYSALLLR